jgi:hypothetical protein
VGQAALDHMSQSRIARAAHALTSAPGNVLRNRGGPALVEMRILPDSPARAFAAVEEPIRIEVAGRFGRIAVRGVIGYWRRRLAVQRRIRRRLSRLNAYRLSSPYNV